jgi:hypothetical protein
MYWEMKRSRVWEVVARLSILAVACLLPASSAPAQMLSLSTVSAGHEETIANLPIRKVIVIGFVGGFVKHDDAKHAEVQFAAQLRHRYPTAVDVKIFGNHSRQAALDHVLRLLNSTGGGMLTAADRAQAKIIIFGHSWGGTETVTLARELERKRIPVLLTIQIDSISKPGEENSVIPSNVEKAVNFYQSRGLLHGRAEILAMDPLRTNIVGNFEMTYKDHPVNCDEFPWFARVFTKPHIEIENDPRVWAEVASLIDSELSGAR